MTRNDILKRVSDYDILNHFIGKHTGKYNLKQGQLIQNCLIPTKQDTPSFNIYYSSKSNEWRYKDFTGMNGSCFDFVMNAENLSFTDCLKRIEEEMFLGNVTPSTHKYVNAAKPVKHHEYKPTFGSFSIMDIDYWNAYTITTSVLKLYDVRKVISVEYTKDEHKRIYKPGGLLFGYDNSSWLKTYAPYAEKKYKFRYFGNKTDNFIFGYNQLPEGYTYYCLVGGEKDVMACRANGINAVSLNSEESHPGNYSKLMDDYERGIQLYIMYDSDSTGRRRTNEICTTYTRMKAIYIPAFQNERKAGKDIADYFMFRKQGCDLPDIPILEHIKSKT